MKKVLKWLGILLLLLVLALVGLGIITNETKPTGIPSPEADAMAKKMLQAVDNTAWDTTGIVQWTFRGKNNYLWDKTRNFVKVNWENNEILLNTKSEYSNEE